MAIRRVFLHIRATDSPRFRAAEPDTATGAAKAPLRQPRRAVARQTPGAGEGQAAAEAKHRSVRLLPLSFYAHTHATHSLLSDHTAHKPRPPRHCTTNTTQQHYKPHHDKHGRMVTAAGGVKDLCDCLDSTCTGCFMPCRKCGGQKCSHSCRNGRTFVIQSIEYQGVNRPPDVNPFLHH